VLLASTFWLLASEFVRGERIPRRTTSPENNNFLNPSWNPDNECFARQQLEASS
jgi:hypothetical protein